MENQRHRTDCGKIFELFIASNSIPVNEVRYRETISRFKEILDGRTDLQIGRQWLIQDGAAPHTANEIMRSLKDYFGRRIILKKSDFSSAPRSPDLSLLDFFLREYYKKSVYRNNPECINDLRRTVENIIREISVATCRKVIRNFEKRVHNCILRQGDHFYHIAL